MEWIVGGVIVLLLAGVVVGKTIKWGKGGDLDDDYYEREWDNRYRD